GSPDVSVDAPLPGDHEGTLLSILPSEQVSAEEAVVQKEFSELMLEGLEDFKSTLNEKELEIYNQRMLSEDKATLQELSDQLSISKERVRQIENRIREKLKEYFEERFGSSLGTFNL
ncbi:MAG: hypothetical protein KDD62_16195, partial [Bdellovibrionales bacterium]|nr:hypothetical protein [Bdellovibrionales bacterium]